MNELLVWGVISVILVAANIRIKKLAQGERLVVLRLGRFRKVAGPGLVVLAPFIDSGKRVDLNEHVPGWRVLSGSELQEAVVAVALGSAAGW